jgi:hypothetical protein
MQPNEATAVLEYIVLDGFISISWRALTAPGFPPVVSKPAHYVRIIAGNDEISNYHFSVERKEENGKVRETAQNYVFRGKGEVRSSHERR